MVHKILANGDMLLQWNDSSVEYNDILNISIGYCMKDVTPVR